MIYNCFREIVVTNLYLPLKKYILNTGNAVLNIFYILPIETEDTKRLKTEALESHCELIRQINLERKKIIQTKEKEMIAGLVNRGMTETDAKINAKLTIESVINDLKEGTF